MFQVILAVQLLGNTIIYVALENAIKGFATHRSFIYQHGKTEVIDALIELGDEEKAIERAEKLSAQQAGKQLIDANPNTEVHILVRRLRELIQWYSYTP